MHCPLFSRPSQVQCNAVRCRVRSSNSALARAVCRKCFTSIAIDRARRSSPVVRSCQRSIASVSTASKRRHLLEVLPWLNFIPDTQQVQAERFSFIDFFFLGGGGGWTKPRIEIELVWTHVHCNPVKSMHVKRWSRVTSELRRWRDVLRKRVGLAPNLLDPQARPYPVRNFGDSLFAEGKCTSIISSTKPAEQDRLMLLCTPACDELDPGDSTEWKNRLRLGPCGCFSLHVACRFMETYCHARNNFLRKDWEQTKRFTSGKRKETTRRKKMAEKTPMGGIHQKFERKMVGDTEKRAKHWVHCACSEMNVVRSFDRKFFLRSDFKGSW